MATVQPSWGRLGRARLSRGALTPYVPPVVLYGVFNTGIWEIGNIWDFTHIWSA